MVFLCLGVLSPGAWADQGAAASHDEFIRGFGSYTTGFMRYYMCAVRFLDPHDQDPKIVCKTEDPHRVKDEDDLKDRLCAYLNARDRPCESHTQVCKPTYGFDLVDAIEREGASIRLKKTDAVFSPLTQRAVDHYKSIPATSDFQNKYIQTELAFSSIFSTPFVFGRLKDINDRFKKKDENKTRDLFQECHSEHSEQNQPQAMSSPVRQPTTQAEEIKSTEGPKSDTSTRQHPVEIDAPSQPSAQPPITRAEEF